MLLRKLETRHMNMIALGGSIGTGIFLASGYALHVAGPGGALLAYSLISLMVFFLITSLGELAIHRPTTGSFCEYSSYYVSPSFGFAMSYNYWFNWAITIAAEISAAAIVMQFWFPDVSAFTFSAMFFVLIMAANILSVRVYGETEYWMSFIKVAVIILFIVLGTLLLFKTPHWGVTNLFLQDGPFHHGFKGFLAVFLVAGFSFQGCELIGVTAGEAKDPQKTIPKAVRNVFWRLLLFYILSTLLISLLIPFNDPQLANQTSVKSSPFTLVFESYLGHGIAADIINAVILTAIISAANASMYASSRTLWYMGSTGQAPKFVAKTTRKGIPVFALMITALVGSVALLSSFVANGALFAVLLTISSLCGFLAWFGIALSHYCFRKKILKGDTTSLRYRAKFFPYAPLLSIGFILFIIIGQGAHVFVDFSLVSFLKQYGTVLAFILLLLGHKYFYRGVLPAPVAAMDVAAEEGT